MAQFNNKPLSLNAIGSAIYNDAVVPNMLLKNVRSLYKKEIEFSLKNSSSPSSLVPSIYNTIPAPKSRVFV